MRCCKRRGEVREGGRERGRTEGQREGREKGRGRKEDKWERGVREGEWEKGQLSSSPTVVQLKIGMSRVRISTTIVCPEDLAQVSKCCQLFNCSTLKLNCPAVLLSCSNAQAGAAVWLVLSVNRQLDNCLVKHTAECTECASMCVSVCEVCWCGKCLSLDWLKFHSQMVFLRDA